MLYELPVVFKIELKKNDLKYVADDQFINYDELDDAEEIEKLMHNESENIWNQYGSGLSLESIPLEWVSEIYFPFDDLIHNESEDVDASIIDKLIETKTQFFFQIPMNDTKTVQLPKPFGTVVPRDKIEYR
eukprot:UN07714